MGAYLPGLDLMQLISLIIAVATNIGAAYLVVVMFSWVRRLKYSRTDLRPLILSLGVAKLALWFWTFSNILNTILFNEDQPLLTLPARASWLFVVLLQIRVTTRIQPAPILADELESLDNRLVLIVEDNEAMARVYRRCFEAAGINAEFATSGGDALTIIEQEQPRMMIVDLGLPDMNGVELVDRAREAGYTGPIIAISGAANLMDVQKLKPAAFIEILSKPIRAVDLVRSVQRWL